MLTRLLLSFSLVFAFFWGTASLEQAVRLFDRVISDGRDIPVFVDYVLASLPRVSFVAIPLAGLIAAMNVVYRHNAEHGTVAIASFGIGPVRTLLPFSALGAAAFLISSLLAHLFVPAANAQIADLSRKAQSLFDSGRIDIGRFLFPADGIVIFAGGTMPENRLSRIFIHDSRDAVSHRSYFGETASFAMLDSSPTLVIENGQVQERSLPKNTLSVLEFEEITVKLSPRAGTTTLGNRQLREISSWRMLADPFGVAKESGASISAVIATLNIRLSDSLHALLLPILGAAAMTLTSLYRRAAWQTVTAAITLVTVTYALTAYFKDSVKAEPHLFLLVYVTPIGLLSSILLCVAFAVTAPFGLPLSRPQIRST